jgi:hypothetical protein
MSTLNLIWTVIQNDNIEIKQFDSEKENKFNLDWFKVGSIKEFSLSHILQPFIIKINLEKGIIYINENQITEQEFNNRVRNNIRLIYFRRHRHTMNGDLSEELKHTILYFMGYQYNDEEGKNRQVLLQIDQNCNIVIGG